MKVLIETWVRVESVVDVDSADEAYSVVSNLIDTKRGRGEIINSARCGGAIRCYDLATGENLPFFHNPSAVEVNA